MITRRAGLALAATATLPRVAIGQPERPSLTVAVQKIANTGTLDPLREHYAWTIRSWEERLRQRRSEVVEMVGEEVTRVWELYLAGGAWTFAAGRMGVDQLLLRRPD